MFLRWLVIFIELLFSIHNHTVELKSRFQLNSDRNTIAFQDFNFMKTLYVKNVNLSFEKTEQQYSKQLKIRVLCQLTNGGSRYQNLEQRINNFLKKIQLLKGKKIIQIASMRSVQVRYRKTKVNIQITFTYRVVHKNSQWTRQKMHIQKMIQGCQINVKKFLNQTQSEKKQKMKSKNNKIRSLVIKKRIIYQNFLVHKKQKLTNITKQELGNLEDSQNGYNKSRNLQTTFSTNYQTEYIKNGDFSNTTCNKLFCDYNKADYKPQSVAFWQPFPDIQVGYAFCYKIGAPDPFRYIASVAAANTTCFRQLVNNLPAGLYELRYRYSAQIGFLLRNQLLLVYLNDTLVDRRIPPSYDFIDVVVTNISITNHNQSVYIKFCGDPNVTSLGGCVLYNVSFKQIQDITAQSDIKNATNTTNATIQSGGLNNSSNASNSINTTNDKSQSQNSQNSSTQININLTNSNSTLDLNKLTPENLFDYIVGPNGNNNSGNSTKRENIRQEFNNFLNQSQFSGFDRDPNNQLSGSANFLGLNFKFQLKINATNIVDVAMKIPAVRQLLSGYFSFFVNLDHLWLYIYHQRNYSAQVKKFLKQIHVLEDTKWNFLAKDFEESALHLSQIKNSINQKDKHTPKWFTSIQKNSRQFLENTFKFFIINLPAALFVFCVTKLLYIFMKKIGLEQILKDFARNNVIILILLEGNSESFVYFLVSDLRMLFSFVFKTKTLNLVSILILFMIFFVLIANPFILRSVYRGKKRIRFYEKCKNNLNGSIFFMIEFGLFNILLGSVHLLCENMPNFQLFCLLGLESIFLIYLLVNFNKKKVYTKILPIWITILTSFVRIQLIVSFFWFELGESSIKGIVQNVELTAIILYLMLWILSILCSLLDQIKGLVYMIYKQVMRVYSRWIKRENKRMSLNNRMNFQKHKNYSNIKHLLVEIFKIKVEAQFNRELCRITKEQKKNGKLRQKIKVKLKKIRQLKIQNTKINQQQIRGEIYHEERENQNLQI